MTKGQVVARALRPAGLILTLALGCGVQDEPEPDVAAPAAAALSQAQVTAARQVGLLPNTFLQPTFFDLNNGFTVGTAVAINATGTAAGFNHTGCTGPWAGGCAGNGYVGSPTGAETVLPMPWTGSGAVVQAVNINNTGDVLGFGGPDPANQDYYRPVLYPHGNLQQPIVLNVAKPYWRPLPTFVWSYALNDVLSPTTGLPTVAGTALYQHGGTMAAWRFEHDTADAISATSSFQTPANAQWTGGYIRTSTALQMNGDTCLSTAAADDTAPYNGAGITMMAWVHPDAAMCPGGPRTVVARTYEFAMSLACNADNSAAQVGGHVWMPSLQVVSPSGTVPFGAWSLVTVSWDTHTIRSYVNNALVAEQSALGGPLPTNGGALSVGCVSGMASSQFQGALDNVAIFDIGMAEDEVARYWNKHTNAKPNFRPTAQYHHWSRYKDGFFDILLAPDDPSYAGSGGVSAMNNAGQIVGDQALTGGGLAATLYDPANGWTNLNTVIAADSGWNLRSARAINQAGVIVGDGEHDGRHSAYRLDPTTGDIVDLGHKPEFPYSDPQFYIFAESVNSAGEVAGAVYDQWPFWPWRAFVYSDQQGLTDLNSLINPDLGWELREAHAINDNGEVVGTAYNANLNLWQGFRLALRQPTASPITVSVVGVAADSAGTMKALFTYASAASKNVNVPYGTDNALSDNTGFIATPPEMPPQWFVPHNPPVFVATMAHSTLTWRVGQSAATAHVTDSPLHVDLDGNLDRVAVLPDGSRVNLDADPHADPFPAGAIVATETSYTVTDAAMDQLLSATGRSTIGATAAGTLPGSFDVSHDGAAEYHLPLELPAGRNGVQPSLELVYSSRSGDGMLGPGWTLRGLHRISRCKRSYAVAQDEGTDPAAITFTASDELCFDGELMVPQGPGEYRIKRDPVSRIVAAGSDDLGTTTFYLYRKDGMVETYGLDASSRVEPARLQPNDAGQTTSTSHVRLTWNLARVTDRYMNQMDVQYAAPDRTLPSGITYTSNSLTGRIAQNVISFNYQFRNATQAFQNGVSTGVSFLLSSITAIAPSPTVGGIAATYKLGYEQLSVSGRPLLTRVRRCDGNDVCMAPTVFEWERGALSYRHVVSTVDDFHCDSCQLDFPIRDAQAGSRNMVAADVDGDGREDLVYRRALTSSDTQPFNPRIRIRRGTPSGFAAAIEPTSFPDVTGDESSHHFFPVPVPLDIDGNGRADFALPTYLFPSPPRTRWELFEGNFGATFQRLPAGVVDPAYSDPTVNPEAGQLQLRGSLVIGDVNGDGRVDIGRQLLDNGTTQGFLGIRFNQNGALGPYAQLNACSEWGEVPVSGGILFFSELFNGDIDGDGRTEVVMKDAAGKRCGTRAGRNGFSAFTTNAPGGGRLLDANGDGLPDLMYRNLSTFKGELWINTGNGFYLFDTDIGTALTDDFLSIGRGGVTDVDGDGRDDILIPGCSETAGGAPATAYLAANGFQPTPIPDIPAGLELREELTRRFRCPSVVMDVDGDGLKDVVQAQLGSDVLHIYFRNFGRPDRLVNVRNGVGASVSVQYSRYDDSSNIACAYPYACGSRNVEVVSGYDVDNGGVASGQPGATHYSMSYKGPRADAQGGGWLGFDRVQRTNGVTGNVDAKTFDLETHIGTWYPYVGLPTNESIEYRLAGSGRKILRSRTISYQTIQSNAGNVLGAYIVVPHVVDDQEFEAIQPDVYGAPQRWTQQTYTYDAFGNVRTKEVLGKLTGTRDFTDNIVSNDDSSAWLIGMVSQTTRTSTSAAGEVDQTWTTFDVNPDNGALRSKIVQPFDRDLRLEVTYGRNLEGMVESITQTSARGEKRSASVVYDALQGIWPAATTNPLGHVNTFAYHPALGVLLSTTDPNGARTTSQYDGFGRPRGRFEPTGASTTFHYARPPTSVGQVVSWSDSTGRSGSRTSDDEGRVVEEDTSAFDGSHSQVTLTRYSAISGRVATSTRPFGATGGAAPAVPWTFGYDEMGRLVQSQAPNETPRIVTYQGLRATELLGTTRTGYRVEDALGRVVQSASVEPTSSAPNQEIITGYDYGPFGRLSHVFHPGGAVTAVSYDHLGRRTVLDDPDFGHKVTDYNAFGEPIRERPAGQAAVLIDRDALGRPLSIRQGDVPTVFEWDSAPSGIGRLGWDVSATGVARAFSYQPSGLPAATTWSVDGTVYDFGWGYDASGRLRTITYPSVGAATRFAVTLGYGADGRVATLSSGSSGTPLWHKIDVSDDGQTFTEAFDDGLSTVYSTDPLTGRLIHIATGAGSLVGASDGGFTFVNPAQDLGYAYLPDGKLHERKDNVLGLDETFGYDNIDRLKTWTFGDGATVTYGYDDTGNLTARSQVTASGTTTNETYVYGENGAGPHAITTGPAGAYRYDPSGRQISRPAQPSLAYTHFDLPIEVTKSDGSLVSFEYDADGTRVVKGTPWTRLITLGGLYERRTQDGVITHALYLPGDKRLVGQVLCNVQGSCGPPAYFHPDNLGTIDTVTSNASLVKREKRDPFGRVYQTGGSGAAGPVTLGFIGQSDDSEIGLINLNHRLYDAQVGRFISPDPLVKNGFDGQALNRYSYAGNNPLALIDPTGLQSEPPPPDETDPPQATLPPLESNEAAKAMLAEMQANDGGPKADIRDEPVETGTVRTISTGATIVIPGVRFVVVKVRQETDAEVPGQGPSYARAPGSDPGMPDIGLRATNMAVDTPIAPVVTLLNGSGPDAPNRAPGTGERESVTVTINSRTPHIPGGDLAAKFGKYHQWISLPDGRSAGMGNGKGVPGAHGQSSPDLPLSPTYVRDHTGETPVTTEQRTVDKGAIESYMTPGRFTGLWTPLLNDCNTWVEGAVTASTPHTVTIPTTPFDGVDVPNAVEYSDGTIHAGSQTYGPIDPERAPFSQGFVF